MKKLLSRWLAIVSILGLLLTATGCGDPAGNPAAPNDGSNSSPPLASSHQVIGFGGGASGGGFYTFANLLSVKLTEAGIGQFSGQATTGGTNNALLMRSGELGICLMNGTDAMEAYTGSNDAFADNPYTDLRAILKWDSAYAVYVVSEDINTFGDLLGKKVVTGAAGSGEFNHTGRILSAADCTLDDINAQMVGVAEGKELLTNGLAAAQLHVGGIPYAAITELMLTGRLKLMSFPEEMLVPLCDVEGAPYIRGVIPANTYDGQEEEIYCLGIPYGIFCDADSLSEDQVYEICKYVFENCGELVEQYASAEFDLEESASFTTVPYHPGAVKYYQEAGILS